MPEYSLGSALAEIGFDTSPAEKQVQQLIELVARMVEQVTKLVGAIDTGFAQMGQSASDAKQKVQASETQVESLSKSVNTLGKNIATAFASAKILDFGMNAAKTQRQIETYYKVMLGGEKAAADELERLRDLADRTGQPFLKLAESAETLLPVVRTSGVEMDKLASVAQRLGIADPLQGTEGAIYAIKELLSGEYLSLSKRFEIPRNELKKLIDESNGDATKLIDGLSEIADKMGFTEENLKALSDAGLTANERFSNAVQELAAKGFEPFLNIVTKITEEAIKLIDQLQKIDPNIVTAIGTMIAGGAIGQLAMKNPLTGGTALGGALGKGAGLIGAGVGGVEIGVAASRWLAEKGWLGADPSLKNISQDDALKMLGDRLKQFVVVILEGLRNWANVFALGKLIIETAFENMRDVLKVASLTLSATFHNLSATLLDIIGKLMDWLTSNAPVIFGSDKSASTKVQLEASRQKILSIQEFGLRDQLVLDLGENKNLKDNLKAFNGDIAAIKKTFDTAITDITNSLSENVEKADQIEAGKKKAIEIINGIFNIPYMVSDLLAGAKPQFSQDQLEGFVKMQEDLLDINDEYAQKRIDEQNDLNSDLLAIDGKAHAATLKAREDAAKAEEKAARDLERKISDINRDTERDEVKRRADADKQLTQDETEYQQRKVDRQRELNRQLEELDRNHRLAVAEAASNLDAVALQREEDRYAVERSNLLGRAGEQDQQEEQRHQQLIEQRRQELEEELADRRAQAVQKIADLRADAELERQDRAAALEEKIADLEVERIADREHRQAESIEKLQELESQRIKERTEREAKFAEEFNSLGDHESAKLDIMRKYQGQAEVELAAWWQRMNATFSGRRSSPYNQPGYQDGQPIPTPGRGFAIGTSYVPETAPFMLHAGEGVISPAVNSLVRRAFGGDYSQSDLAMAFAGGSRGADFGGGGGAGDQLSFEWSGNLILGDIGNRSDAEVIALAEVGVTNALNKLADIKRNGAGN